MTDLPGIVEDYLPKYQLHVLGGDSGAGKTSLTASLLKAIITEDTLFDKKIEKPRFVGVLASDRLWSDHAQWYELVGLKELPHYSIVDESFDTTVFEVARHATTVTGILERLIDSIPGPPPEDSLIIVDPVALFIGGDSNAFTRVYAHLAPISQMLSRRKWTLWGIHHAAKMRQGQKERYLRPEDRLLGSMAIQACAGTVFFLRTELETEGPPELIVRPHHAARDSFVLERSEETGLLSLTDDKAETRQLAERYLNVLNVIPTSGGVTTTDVMSLTKLSRRTTQRVLGELKKSGEIASPVHGWWIKKVRSLS